MLMDNHRIWASLSFIFVIIFFGIPMWWKTTEVYRVSLPFAGIKELSDDPIKVIRNVGIYAKESDRAKLLIGELQKLFVDDISEIRFFEITLPKQLVEDSKSIASLEENVEKHSGLSNGERALIEWDHVNSDVAIRSTRFAVFSKGSSTEKMDIRIDMDEIMPILLHQLKRLIGVDSKIARSGTYSSESLHDIEVERYFTYGTIFLLNKATSTLQSLIQLLDSINNIVINDEVGIAVNEAYQHIIDSKGFLKVNDILNATAHAKKAFIQSERAFYYPSMLALLYFPDDQKYAIYIPLFLPIMIPVVLSMKTIWLFFFKSNKIKPKTE
ncbi:hypothetical protein HA402_010658 [Bradysia odoriphaga]|nr:hypothetical protein HA402_010658 [Bradysia odoriphaga]